MTESSNPIRLISEYIIGTELSKDNYFGDVETLQIWLDFKDKYYGMSNYRLEITQNISFLHIIELPVFEKKLKDLVLIYHKSNPHGDKEDFINDTFGGTLTYLEKFISIINWYFIPYTPLPNIENDIYSCDEFYKGKIVDIILEPSKDINWYKQYYKKIIEVISNLDFDSKKIELNLISTSKPIANEGLKNVNKTFADYLLHDDKLKLAERLHYEFKNERGKNIRLLIEALLKNIPPLISIGGRQNKKFHEAMKIYFNRDIGTYQSIFDLKPENLDTDPDFKAVKTKIDFILASMKNQS